jgi:glucosamine kinase
MSLTVVVDGGGSGCRLAAFDAQGVRCATAADGPASLTLGLEQAWMHINRGISSLAAQLGKTDEWLPSQLCMGLAGSLQSTRRENFLALIPKSIEPTLVTDGHAQLVGACNGQPGACLAIGTGSVLHWLDEHGKTRMAGGWGFPMGDEASGAWLGAQLINAYLWYFDNQRPGDEIPLVFQTLEARIGRETSDIQVWSTKTNSTELASLAPDIVSAAEQGDDLANSILDHGAELIQHLVDIAPSTLPIYLIGGLGNIYLPRLDQIVRDRCKSPHGDALSGLYTISQSEQLAPS